MKKIGLSLVAALAALVLGAGFFGCDSAGAGGEAPLFAKVAIPVPDHMVEVVDAAWSIQRVGSRSAVITEDARAFCTEPSSFYWFWGDDKIEQYEAKPEQWAVVYHLAVLTKEVYERDLMVFDFIAVPVYVPPYEPANPEPVPPLFTFYILDKDNNIYLEVFISEALAAPMTQEEYYLYVANIIRLDVENAGIVAPEGMPYHWVGGGTKIIEPPPIEEPPPEEEPPI